jgi:precorrin-6B methylase 2
MAKRRIRIEVENDLNAAIQKEADKLGISKAEVVRSSAQKFLSKVNDTSKNSETNQDRKTRKL